MTNNPLILCLSRLSRKEMTRFRDFAHSPYFHKHKEVQALLAYLSECYPDFSQRKCSREVLFQKIFPGLPHSQPELAVIFSYAMRLFEQFQRVEQAIEEGLLEDEALSLKHSRLKGLFPLFLKKSAEKAGGGKKLVPIPIQSAPGSGAMERRIRLLAEQDLAALSQADYGQQHLEEKQAWLDAQYLSEKLRDACELLLRRRLKRSASDNAWTEQLVSALAASPERLPPHPAVKVYFHLYKLLSSNDLKHYEATLEALQQSELALPAGEAQNIFNHLQNHYIEQINRGEAAYLRELFGVYQQQLERGLLLSEGRLPEWHYKNIVTTGLRLGEADWVLVFLEKYRPLLPPAVAENAWRYNLAAWHQHAGQFEQAMRLLLQVEFTDLRYSLDAKALLLRCYYELEEEEALQALCGSFRQFILRHGSLTEFQQKGYLNLLKFTRRAFRLKMGKGIIGKARWQADFEKLKAETAASEAIFNKTWLLERIEKLS